MPLPIWPAPMMPMVLIVVACSAMGCPRLCRAALFFERLVKRRNDFEQIADQAVIGHLEEWRFFVLVDRDDDLGIFHAGEMLDRARDADGDVELRCHDLAGLADLVVVGHE